ncbi:MAG: hypothetical protein ACRCZF_03840, partial [Gemmataceae bacterium]
PAAPVLWASLSDELTTVPVDFSTKPSITPAKRSSYRNQPMAVVDAAVRPKRRIRPWMWGVALVAFLGFGGVAGFIIFGDSRTTTTVTKPGAVPARTWLVQKGDSSKPDTVSTLTMALQKASPGDVIRILDDEIDDGPVAINNPKRLKDIVIESGVENRPVRWIPPAPSSVKPVPLLELRDVEGVTLRNITINLRGQYEIGVSLSGYIPGTTLTGIEVLEPKLTGFRLATSGDQQRPVQLVRCRVAAKGDILAAVVLAGTSKLATRNLTIKDCRFEGPGQTAVRIEGLVLNVELNNNRVFRWKNAIVLGGDPPASSMKLAARGNTFAEIGEAAIRLDQEYKGEKPHEFVIENNLFLQTKSILQGPSDLLPGWKFESNSRDRTTGVGRVKATVKDLGEIKLNTDATEPAAFLIGPTGAKPVPSP